MRERTSTGSLPFNQQSSGLLRRFLATFRAGAALAISVIASSEAHASVQFDGIDITAAPIYLSGVFELPGVTIDPDALTTNLRPTIYDFAIDNTGRSSRGVFRDIATDAFFWSISGSGDEEELLLTFDPGETGFSATLIVVPFPFEASNPQVQELAAKYGQQTIDQLLSVNLNELVPAGQFEVQVQIENIRVAKVSPGIWNMEERFNETLVIPQNVIDAVPGGWQGDSTPTADTQVREQEVRWKRYGGTLFSNYSAEDIPGAWALPVFLRNPGDAPMPPATRDARYFSEKVDFFANGTALGSYSGIAFDWALNGDQLVLTSGDESFVYTLLDENNGVALLSLQYNSFTHPEGFQIAGLGGRFRPSGLARAQNLAVNLPTIYQSLINGEPIVSGGTLACEGISGWLFTVAGTARQIFGCSDTTPGSRRFRINPTSTVTLEEEQVTYLRGTGSFAQRRYWQLLSETPEGLIVAIERFEILIDGNGDGVLENSESSEGAVPRLIVLKPLDLSLSGEPWDELDADNDGLNNFAEDLQGTDYGNPDSDGDLVLDGADACQQTAPGEPVDAAGCSLSQLDTDGDGLSDDADLCEGTPQGQEINAAGCSPEQLATDADRDGDGIPDSGEAELGTAIDKADTDGDGFSDLEELEAGTNPLDPDDAPERGGLDIILIKAALDRV